MKRIAVIMAGGRGSRFWPLSHSERPKQLLRLFGERSMLRQTVDRLRRLESVDAIIVVVSEAIIELVDEELRGLDDVMLLVEPVGRDTAPCVALATHMARELGGDQVRVGIFPADHYVGDVDAFCEVAERAYDATSEASIVTIGIAPSGPETGYGYIEAVGDGDVRRVARFREKPNRATALDYLARGGFYWNAGMFFYRAAAMWDALEAHAPGVALPIGQITFDGTSPKAAEIREAYDEVTPISIDYAVMERARDIAVVPGSFAWSDVGTWDSFYDLRGGDADGNVTEGPAIMVDCRNALAFAETGRPVACLGLNDIVVVDSDAGVLVMERGLGQEVRRVVRAVESGPTGAAVSAARSSSNTDTGQEADK